MPVVVDRDVDITATLFEREQDVRGLRMLVNVVQRFPNHLKNLEKRGSDIHIAIDDNGFWRAIRVGDRPTIAAGLCVYETGQL